MEAALEQLFWLALIGAVIFWAGWHFGEKNAMRKAQDQGDD